MAREPLLMVGIGRKGVGKSFASEKMIQSYVKGNPAKGVPPRRCLILDVNDEYSAYKAIRIQDVALFSMHPIIEARRVRPFMDDGKKMTLDDIAQTLFVLLDTFKNGLFLIEDVNKYISDTMPNDLVGAICTNRHIGVDILLHYQSIGRITSKVWQNVNLIRIHKITDSVKRHKHKFEDKFEYLSIAEVLINQKYESGDIRFFLYVDVDNDKIYGSFTDADLEGAITKYLSDNYNQLINPMLNARDENGKKIHTPQTAIAEVKKRMLSYRKK